MSLNEFVTKWLGKRTDYDKVYAYQCVDLILQYVAECYGITTGVWGNAIDYWTKPTARLLQDFEKVTGTPRAGDIVILNPTSTNPYGHIMIAVNSTTAIEQNGATGDGDGLGGDEVRYRLIPTGRVAGLLRKKGQEDMAEKITPDTSKILQHAIIARNGLRGRAYALDGSTGLPWVGGELTNKFISDVFNSPEARQWRDTNDPASVNDINARLDRLPTAEAAAATAQGQVAELTKVVGVKDGEITRLTKEVESLKAQVGDNSKFETLKALLRELFSFTQKG